MQSVITSHTGETRYRFIKSVNSYTMKRASCTTCIFVVLLCMMCSVVGDESRSRSYRIDAMTDTLLMAKPYFVRRAQARNSIHTGSVHSINRRDTGSQQEPVVCNDVAEQRKWTCTCRGCLDYTVESPACCHVSTDTDLVNQSVVISLNSITPGDYSQDFEATIKDSVARSLSDYCTRYPEECPSALGPVEHEDANTPTVSPQNNNHHTAHLFDVHDVVVVNLSYTTTDNADLDGPQLMLDVTLFVLLKSWNETSTTRVWTDMAVPGYILETALLNDTVTLQRYLEHDVISVKTLSQDGVANDDIPGQTHRIKMMLVAMGVLGFILVVSCIVSAAKAVR